MIAKSYAASHIGYNPSRTTNEDSFLAIDDRQLYAVADGMGGHAAGEVASRIAVNVVKNVIIGRSDRWGSADWFDSVFRIANENILREGHAPERARMGTTLTAASIVGDVLHVAHAGDSACYLLRAGWARRLTEEQTVAGAVRAQGKVPHPRQESILVNCLGVSSDSFLGAQHVPVHLVPGDVIVLCSDGLTGYLASERDLATLYASAGSAPRLAQALVDHALASGGHDNVTAVVIEVR